MFPSRLIPEEALPHIENMIYLPMLNVIFERDLKLIDIGTYKFKSPYLDKINDALNRVQKDLRQSKDYLKHHNIKVNKGRNDGLCNNYRIIDNGCVHERRYLNVRLRNRSNELMMLYLGLTDNTKATTLNE